MSTAFTLKFACDDRPGIVSRVTTGLAAIGGNIQEASHFNDQLTGRFFCRLAFTVPAGVTETTVRENVSDGLTQLAATWSVTGDRSRMRVLIMASKLDHCLADLLYRWRIGELPMDVVGVVSNHPCEVYQHIDLSDVPFHHLPVTKENKPEQEAKLLAIVDEYEVDLVVLARYMQILSDELSASLAGRCINIHHSFLPGFKGAKPYHQAYERGVKLIGATAHYVTGDLDEGPIIAQDVEPVTHRDTPEQLVRKGRDIERRVLARAVRHHLESQVLLNGRTTVVFPD
ncbi:formyltetrahydrofolate deformylase [Streptomyces sp. MA5143a]|uniref:formyltetrahydrofolate deformylase n=1 Tax=Streptomyces sp. MA5143a TaxID=2083010 RepID=UPI000D1A5978|nr:formyltetrahydrofolate deformylase [Streptomyces sp. MA5143a]SPF00104.1 Formyltetrahydrofolate deformylase [Streptomyces sp. MA5143a]